MNIEIKDKHTLQIDGNIIQNILDGEIEKIVKFDQYLYLLIQFPKKHPEQNTNIWKVNIQGNIIWKVESFGHNSSEATPYVELNIKDEKLTASNWKGGEFHIDILTGKVKNINKRTRPW